MTSPYSLYQRWSLKNPVAQNGVIVGTDIAQQWILPWWWHHYHQFNTYPITFIDFGMSNEAKKWCQKRGNVVPLPVPDIYVKGKQTVVPSLAHQWEHVLGTDFWDRRNGWFKKPLACLLSPYLNSIWIDLDCEIRGSIQELFSYCNSPAGFSVAKDLHDPLSNKKGYNSGVIAFKRGIPLFETWATQAFECNHLYAGDQDILTHLISQNNIIIEELPQIYNWSRYNEQSSKVKILHWHGRHGKAVISASPYLEFI